MTNLYNIDWDTFCSAVKYGICPVCRKSSCSHKIISITVDTGNITHILYEDQNE